MAARRRADYQLLHIHIWRVQKAALVADRQHRQRIGLAHRCHPRALDRIHCDIDRVAAPAADFFADIEHRRFVDFAFADHNLAVDINGIQDVSHRVDGSAIGTVFIAASQPAIAG